MITVGFSVKIAIGRLIALQHESQKWQLKPLKKELFIPRKNSIVGAKKQGRKKSTCAHCWRPEDDPSLGDMG
jgi:hypothetical protein